MKLPPSRQGSELVDRKDIFCCDSPPQALPCLPVLFCFFRDLPVSPIFVCASVSSLDSRPLTLERLAELERQKGEIFGPLLCCPHASSVYQLHIDLMKLGLKALEPRPR
jgi:hypothetical protein